MCQAWARVSLDKGLGPSDGFLPRDCPWPWMRPQVAGLHLFHFGKWEAWKWGSWKAVLALNVKMMKCYVSAYFTEISSLQKTASGKYITRLLGKEWLTVREGNLGESRPAHSLKDQLVLEFRGTHKSVTSHTRARGIERQGDIQELGTCSVIGSWNQARGLVRFMNWGGVIKLYESEDASSPPSCPATGGLSCFLREEAWLGRGGRDELVAVATRKPPVCALKDQTHCCFGNLCLLSVVAPAQPWTSF